MKNARSQTAPTVEQTGDSVLRRLLLHVIDDQDGHRVFLRFELKPELLFNGFGYADAAIRVGHACRARRLVWRLTPGAAAALERAPRCPGQSEIPAALEFGQVDREIGRASCRERV